MPTRCAIFRALGSRPTAPSLTCEPPARKAPTFGANCRTAHGWTSLTGRSRQETAGTGTWCSAMPAPTSKGGSVPRTSWTDTCSGQICQPADDSTVSIVAAGFRGAWLTRRVRDEGNTEGKLRRVMHAVIVAVVAFAVLAAGARAQTLSATNATDVRV